MAFTGWQIGLDIQADGVRAVAVQWHRQGWQLRHWRHLPFPAETPPEGILPWSAALGEILRQWRRQMPKCHHLRVGFPARRVLQRQIPVSDNRLQESARELYVAGAAARQLQMPAAGLYCDYREQQQFFNVTAARRSEVDGLLACLASAGLYPQAVIPGDQALHGLSSVCYPTGTRWLVHQEEEYWLWAQSEANGGSGWLDKRQAPDLPSLCSQLGATPGRVAMSCASPQLQCGDVPPLDAWRQVVQLQPPLPVHGALYTLALGLAMGTLCR